MEKNKNILISGANGLIGKSLSQYLLSKGHNIICGDENFKHLKKDNKRNMFLFKSDLSKEKNIEKFLKFGLKKLGSIDAFIHCLYPKTKDWGQELEKLKQKSLNINLGNHLGGTIIFSKHLIKYFSKRKKGNIILFSSIYGFATPNFEDYTKNIYSTVEYGAIKSGIISITKYLAKLYKKKGLRINCISPGGIKDNQDKKFIKNYNKRCNSKGMLDPNDLNDLVGFLLNDGSKHITGQNLVVDDGWSL